MALQTQTVQPSKPAAKRRPSRDPSREAKEIFFLGKALRDLEWAGVNTDESFAQIERKVGKARETLEKMIAEPGSANAKETARQILDKVEKAFSILQAYNNNTSPDKHEVKQKAQKVNADAAEAAAQRMARETAQQNKIASQNAVTPKELYPVGAQAITAQEFARVAASLKPAVAENKSAVVAVPMSAPAEIVKPVTAKEIEQAATRLGINLNEINGHRLSSIILENAAERIKRTKFPNPVHDVPPEVIRGLHECREQYINDIGEAAAIMKRLARGEIAAKTLAAAKSRQMKTMPVRTLKRGARKASQGYHQLEAATLEGAKVAARVTGVTAASEIVKADKERFMIGDVLGKKRPRHTVARKTHVLVREAGKQVGKAAGTARAAIDIASFALFPERSSRPQEPIIVKKPSGFTSSILKPLMPHFDRSMRAELAGHFKRAADEQAGLRIFGAVTKDHWLLDANGKRMVKMKEGQSVEFLGWSGNNGRAKVVLTDDSGKAVTGEASVTRRYVHLVPFTATTHGLH